MKKKITISIITLTIFAAYTNSGKELKKNINKDNTREIKLTETKQLKQNIIEKIQKIENKKEESKQVKNLSFEEVVQKIEDIDYEIKTSDYIARANNNELDAYERKQMTKLIEKRNSLLDLKMKKILERAISNNEEQI